MAFNGSGVFNRLFSWVSDANNGLDISSSRTDQDSNDIANGLSNCICRDGQSTVTADIPFSSHKLTGVANGVARTDAATVGQVQDGTANYVSLSGTDTYTGNLTPAIAAYATGADFALHFANANTSTTPTVNLNGNGGKTVVRPDASALVAGDLNGDHILRYDGTNLRVLNPAKISASNVTGGTLAPAAAINESSATIASAATVNIGAASANYIFISGTTTITAFDTVQSGTERTLEFAGALTLTHNGTSLILPGAANITTAAGDVAKFRSEGSGNWRCASYMPASGLVLPAALASNSQALGGSDTTHPVTSAGLASAQNLASTGHMKFPGGLILNWGTLTFSSASSAAATFDLAFPASASAAVAASNSTGVTIATQSLGLTGFTAAASASFSGTVYYFAVGH